jgi:hypothetical protein
MYFSNKNAIRLMKERKKKKVDWAQIIYNSLCNELDRWYKYVKKNKGDKKDTYQLTLIVAKIIRYLH